MRRKPVILAARPLNSCPFEAELERLERLRLGGHITLTDYLRDRDAVRAKRVEAGRG